MQRIEYLEHLIVKLMSKQVDKGSTVIVNHNNQLIQCIYWSYILNNNYDVIHFVQIKNKLNYIFVEDNKLISVL